jgi:hypothetical protein
MFWDIEGSRYYQKDFPEDVWKHFDAIIYFFALPEFLSNGTAK